MRASPSAITSRPPIARPTWSRPPAGSSACTPPIPATVYLSTWARVDDIHLEDVDRTLYEERRLVRMLAMRRTMFVVAVEEAPILHAAASLGVARTERRRNRQLVELLGVEDPDAWMRDAEAAALAALQRRGEATPAELAADVPGAAGARARQRRQALRRGDRYLEPGPAAPRGRGTHRARTAARDVDQQPVPLDPDRALARRADGGASRARRAGRARPSLARTLRARHRSRPALVDGADRTGDPGRPRGGRSGRGRPRWTDGPGAAR